MSFSGAGSISLKAKQNMLNNPKTRYHSINNYNPITERVGSSHNQNGRLNHSSMTIDTGNQKFRDSSIYNKNLSIQIMKEQAFKNREIELTKKYEGMDLEKLKELLPNISNRSTYNIEQVYTRPLSPTALNKQSYLEIFNSRKESMRKHLNYINYTNTNYNVVSNNVIGNEGDAYQNYLVKRLDYESQVPQYKAAQENNYFSSHNQVIAQKIMDPSKFDMISSDRKQMRLQMKSHILKNIKKAKERSVHNTSIGAMSNGFSQSQNQSKIGHYQTNNVNTQRQSIDQTVVDVTKTKIDKHSFTTKNFYKYLEHSKPKSVIQTRAGSNQYQKLNLSQFKTKQYQDIDQKPDNDIISVIGKQNSIKQNAYTDLNVDLETQSKINDKYMKKLADKRRQMSSQANKFRLNHNNLKELSRQSNMSMNNSKSARDIPKANKSYIGGMDPLSEYSNNNSVAFSKRWQNLENYIQNKKSKKVKDLAYSHAQSIAENNEKSELQLSDSKSQHSKIQQSKIRYRTRSVAEPLEVIQDELDGQYSRTKNDENKNEFSIDEISMKDLDQFQDDDDLSNSSDSENDTYLMSVEDHKIQNVDSKNRDKNFKIKVSKLKEKLKDEQKKRGDLEKLLQKVREI
eukprot:403343658